MLQRVQTTPKFSRTFSPSVTLTFTNPPTVGNGIVVPVVTWSGTPATCTLTDNQGNTGEVAVSKVGGDGKTVCTLLYIPRLFSVVGAYTVTVDFGTSQYSVSCAMEVTGSGAYGLAHHIVASQASTVVDTAPGTGASPVSTVDELFVVALVGSSNAQSSIAVEQQPVTWAQEFEELSWTNTTGEADSRPLSGQVGVGQFCNWTFGTPAHWAAVLAAFIAAPTSPASRITQDAVEVISQPYPAVRVTQDALEVLSLPSATVLMSQYAVETLVLVTADARVTQYAVETLTSLFIPVPPAPTGGGETSHPWFS